MARDDADELRSSAASRRGWQKAAAAEGPLGPPPFEETTTRQPAPRATTSGCATAGENLGPFYSR